MGINFPICGSEVILKANYNQPKLYFSSQIVQQFLQLFCRLLTLANDVLKVQLPKFDEQLALSGHAFALFLLLLEPFQLLPINLKLLIGLRRLPCAGDHSALHIYIL